MEALAISNLDNNLKGEVTLNNIIQSLIKEVVRVEVSGKRLINGTVIDSGSDVIVLFNGIDYVYIPVDHIQRFGIYDDNEEDIQAPSESPNITALENEKELTFREVLTQAQGNYVEIYVTNGQPLHGYIMSLMNDYFIFYSPIYKTMYISIQHLKWLIPYSKNESPYGMNNQTNLVQSNGQLLANTFKEQVEKFQNTIVVLNIGGDKSHIGKINNVEEQIVEIKGARTNSYYLNLDHIKTLHEV